VTAQTRHGSGHDWDDARKAALFADIVSLKLSIDEAAALHGLRVDVIQEWLRQFRRSALVAFDERLKKTLIDQGANADALTAAEFTGHVEDVSIADLVQTIEIAGKDAVITVTHEGSDSRMWCSAGAIVDAESGRLTGEAAVYRILGFERGRMVADLRPEQRTRTIYAATHRLLLEALRRKDEGDKLEKRLGNINRFYRLGDRSTSSRVRVSTDELSILRIFDGPRRLRDVLAQSHIGDLETLTALVRLVDDGYLMEVDSAPGLARGGNDCRTLRSGPSPMMKTERLDSAEQVDARRDAERASRFPGSGSGEPRRLDVTERETLPRAAALRAASRLDSSEAESEAHGAHANQSESSLRHETDGPSSAASCVPMSMSQPDRTSLPRWAFAAIAVAILAPAALWFGETMSNFRWARRAALSVTGSEQTERAALEAAPLLPVVLRVEPASAEIWLDRHPVASGRLDLVLPKDGSTHELRVAATGYIPVTLLFADVPPPKEIRLEALPAPPAQPAAAAPAQPSARVPAQPPASVPAQPPASAPAQPPGSAPTQLPAAAQGRPATDAPGPASTPTAQPTSKAPATDGSVQAPDATSAAAAPAAHATAKARAPAARPGPSADTAPAAAQIIELLPRDEPNVLVIE
jgi:hypothetical protein